MSSASPLWTGVSSVTLATVGTLCKVFLQVAQRRVDVQGLDEFLRLMDERKLRGGQAGGVVTVSNHISVMDDPLMWGILPVRKMLTPSDIRWGLGSHDICFTSRPRSLLFSLGQIIPTHRLHKSTTGLGGLFQPALDKSVHLLSHPVRPQWVHVFPEGRVHQHPTYQMRYFKWGVSRLILEPPIQPTVIPMFIEGFCDIMHESRGFPRFIPRTWRSVRIVFGEPIPPEVFQDLRKAWKDLCKNNGYDKIGDSNSMPEALRTGEEAVRLRIETTARVREEIVKLRRQLDWPEEEETAKLVETYKSEGMRKEGKTEQGAWEKDT
ncbi:hypothetical protein BDZ91DRAFT_782815 [Kalaharituber pfeilii]|nr:hypothetical protein BDZ91DRAFT_782815 [Kalaharituber pfeilii]